MVSLQFARKQLSGLFFKKKKKEERKRERELELENFNTQGQQRQVHLDLTASPCYTTNTNKHGNTTNKYYKHDLAID